MRTVALVGLLLAIGGGLADGAAGRPQSGLTRIAVGYVPGAAATVASAEQAVGATTVQQLDDIDANVVTVPVSHASAVVAALGSLPIVRYAQLDGRAYADGTPNDEFWPQEWSPITTDAPQAWALTTGSPSVVVAVVDTGVDAMQPDLAGRVLPGTDFVNGDSSASDDNGHGTAVAGVVAAQGDNGIGVAGYCWQCRILPVKVLGSDGSGFNSWVAAGILWATDHGAQIINTSLGSVTDDLTVAAAAQYASLHGALVVAAAGNDGSATLQYPAALPGVLSVGASDQNDQPYSFSNTGAAVEAPGENLTTGLQGTYVSFLGTSSATPVVSGIAALALSTVPGASPAQITQAIESTTVPSAGAVYGRVDAYAAVHALAPGLMPGAPVSTPPSPASSAPAASRKAHAAATATLAVRGRLTRGHPTASYAVRTGSGELHATITVQNPGHLRLEARLVAPDGTTIVRRAGTGSLHFQLAVDPMRYRIVVGRRSTGAAVAYRVSLVFPAPANLDSTRR